MTLNNLNRFSSVRYIQRCQMSENTSNILHLHQGEFGVEF